ncbi:MAG: cell division protein FtsA [Desulfobacula sp.]|uniref:cell division protein FtsA n=1 Tax=Desulfobacula sp. TaxID=2593537 RepID=UPI001D2E91C5|nr:cell division protein FtsA [Desulfobacula sp.]MBT3483811.1 cell division protein FtsA [Desulfobacula sp.]MBT3802999.1 cell division protein FtsA [Desulfobacula sp.]MBT4023488.1 cell division protein FtsA [Desulfobacula sp.]MBT4197047.1 cell division protein FtsA [Desulfobacula sp.]
MQGNEKIIVGLDIGTTQITAVVGEMLEDEINVIGVGSHPSTGLRKGIVVNIESTVDSIKKAVEEAELMAGCDISSVYAGIAGNHIKGLNSHGLIAIKGREITNQDVERVIDAAKAIAIPADREILHVIPQEFIVDDMESIQNPVGMTAIRLEANIHIITGAVSSARNIVKCCNKAGLEVCDIALESLASGEAVLTDEEKELGCVVADMGGGTTDLALFKDNNLKFIYNLTLGGHNLTNDISIGLRTPILEAEKIKIEHGTCVPENVKSGATIEVPGVGGRPPKKLSKRILSEILEPRVEEIFSLLKKELLSNGLENSFPAGFVLTGGSVVLDGINDLAESVFNVPVRIGKPNKIGGLKEIVKNPAYATGVGLVLLGSSATCRANFQDTPSQGFTGILYRMKQWFKNII